MPPRQSAAISRLSVLEIPILPFLAPRGFTPWPRSLLLSRAHATAVERRVADAELEKIHGRISSNDLVVGPFCWQEAGEVVDGSTHAHATKKEISLGASIDGILQRGGQPRRPESRKDHPNGAQKGTDECRAITGYPSRELSRTTTGSRERLFVYHRNRSIANRDMLPVRKRIIRLATNEDSNLDSFWSHWSADISRLNRKYDSQLGHRPTPNTLRRRLARKRGESPFFFELMANASCSALSAQWSDLSPRKRKQLWPDIMLPALYKCPSSALKFLVASMVKPYPPGYAISDSIEYIVCYYLYRVENPNPQEVDALFRTVVRLLDHFDDGYIHLTQKTIFWLLINLEIEEASRLHTTLTRQRHFLHENTILHFIDIFSRAGKTELAVDALRRLHEVGVDFARPSVESVCATLLQRRYRSSSDAILSDSDLFALMLNLGLQPNIIFYNILLQNAIHAGDSETAWQIHDMIQENGFNADASTYSILLNDAKVRMDRPTIERVLGIVRSKDIRNEYIITDLLHAMFILNEQERKAAPTGEPRSSPFKQMLSLYAEFFDTGPLKDLLAPAYRNHLPEPNETAMHPPKQTLTVMLIALIRGFTNKEATPEWYDCFRGLVLKGDPNIAPLAESTHVYDAVIMSLGRWHGTLHLCTKVVRDMYDSYGQSQHARVSSEETFASEHGRNINGDQLQRPKQPISCGSSPSLEGYVPRSQIPSPKWVPEMRSQSLEIDTYLKNDNLRLLKPKVFEKHRLIHCQPSVRTWSILLKAFMDHHQPRAAEKVLTMMQTRGITPNQITWNSLAVGYARMQDVANTVNVIERFENEGWEVDECTMMGLQWIKNRETLIQALQQKDHRQEEKQRVAERRGAVSVEKLSGGVSEVISIAEIHNSEKQKCRRRPGNNVYRRARQPLEFDPNEIVFPEK